MLYPNTEMKFDPSTGESNPYPKYAAKWRIFHGKVAWLFNPWTGVRRSAKDIGSDVYGELIIPKWEPLVK